MNKNPNKKQIFKEIFSDFLNKPHSCVNLRFISIFHIFSTNLDNGLNAVMKTQLKSLVGAALLLSSLAFGTSAQAADREFLNVSYDATREFYDEFNKSFGKYWQSKWFIIKTKTFVTMIYHSILFWYYTNIIIP